MLSRAELCYVVLRCIVLWLFCIVLCDAVVLCVCVFVLVLNLCCVVFVCGEWGVGVSGER